MNALTITFSPTKKQYLALEYLGDMVTEEILFGGAAGGGKSKLGAFWLIKNCLVYRKSRWLLCRAVLKHLKESTLKTLFETMHECGLRANIDYGYNSIDGLIKFANGSEIVLKDLEYYPADPEYERLSSSEYCGAFIDEASQITSKAKEIVLSRLRYKLKEFNIIGKLLCCTNPTKNWAYFEFYKPYKENKLKATRQFIPALPRDNPHLPESYIESLNRRDKVTKERLLYGNWEYDDDLTKLFDYEAILKIFSTNPQEKEMRFLTVDVARMGNDKTVIIQWHGLYIEKIYTYSKQDTRTTSDEIMRIADNLGIEPGYIIIDEDGVGGGVKDNIPYSKGFLNNSSPLEENRQKPNYQNLKAQCYYKLAEYVNGGKIGCYSDVSSYIRELIIQDLEQVRQKNPDKDGKLQIIGKDEIKEIIGRSPDYGDAMMMRMYFEIKKPIMPFCIGVKAMGYNPWVKA